MSSSSSSSSVKKRKYVCDSSVVYFKSDKQNGFAFLSNFWPFVSEKSFAAVSEEFRNADASFVVDGVTYRSVEHFFQSQKYAVVNPAAAEEIRSAPTALEAKKTNTKWKRIQPIDVVAWERDGEAMMLKALRAKFAPGSALARALIATAGQRLVEVPGRSKDRWSGEDGLMAKLLATVRDELTQNQENQKAASSVD
jgi:ribA/ribD-fused uncharacterized protein